MVELVIQRLRRGYDPQPMFDPRSWPAYALTIAALIVGAGLFFGSGFSLAPGLAIGPPLWVASALVGAWLARRAGLQRPATGLETTAIVYAQGFAFLLIIYALMALPIPMVDQYLARSDRALGLYWPTLSQPFRDNPGLTDVGKIVYRSFTWQPAVVTVALAAAGMHDRAWRFVTVATVSLCLASLIGPMLPADTPVVFYHVPPWDNLQSAWKASRVIHEIREGHRMLDQSMLTGLLTMPSYHATSAILFAWALHPVKLLRWPILLLNAAMLVFTVVIGGHYVVDLFGGALLAVVSIKLCRAWFPECSTSPRPGT